MGIQIQNYKTEDRINRLVQLLPDDEMFKEYSLPNFINWVNYKIDILNEEARNNEGFKKAVRHGLRQSNKFYNEAVPLKHFLEKQKLFCSSASISMAVWNAAYDALVVDENNIKWHVEITKVDEDKQEHYRRVILNEAGCVGADTSIKKSADGKLIESEQECGIHEIKIRTLLGKIEKALNRKHNKTYPGNTILVLSAGYLILKQTDEVVIKNLLSKYSDIKFSNIFFVSGNGSFVY